MTEIVRRVFIGLIFLGITSITGNPTALQDVQPGVNYDPQSQSWYFYGVPVERDQYFIPPANIDLMQVVFIGKDGMSHKVWVAVGMSMGADYLSTGTWLTLEDASAIRLDETLLKIYLSETAGTLKPRVDKYGIRWESCDRQSPCRYAQLLDAMHNDLSNQFIQHETAPGWYPWGFLFWNVEIISSHKADAPINSRWRQIR